MKVALIIPAAGIGKRFSKNEKKQFYEINNKPILFYTLKRLLLSYDFYELIVGINKEDTDILNNIILSLKEDKFLKEKISNIKIFQGLGGAERVNTVLNCIKESTSDFVAIHDGVRPFVNSDVIQNVIEAGIKYNAAICAMPIRDTIKRASNNHDLIEISETVSRDNLYLAHTPQVFNREIIIQAIEFSLKHNLNITDEASAYEFYSENNKEGENSLFNLNKVHIVMSNYENIKVTYAEDKAIINTFFNLYFN